MLRNGFRLGIALFLPLLAACSSLLQVPSTIEVSLRFPREVQTGSVAEGTLKVTARDYTGEAVLRILSPQGLTLLSPTQISVESGEREYPVRVQVAPTLAPGEYQVVIGVRPRGLEERQATATLRVVAPSPPSFTLSLSSDNLTVQQGQSGQTTLTLTPQNGFTGAVILALVDRDGNPVSGIGLSPTSANVTGTDPVTQVLTVSVGSGVAPGTYNLTLRATSGSLTRTANLNLTVTAPPPSPDFTISLNPTSLTVQQGASGQTTLTLTPQGGFTGTVNLSLLDGNGNPVSGITLSPTSVQVAGSNPTSQTLTVSVAESVAPRSYSLQVRATSGNLTRTANLGLTVTPPPGFTLSLSPESVRVREGSTTTLTATLTPEGGFQGAVLLTVQAPPFVQVSPTSAALNLADGPRTTTFTLRGLSEGSGTLTLRAESGSLARTASILVTVDPYALEASATPATGYVPYVPPTTTLTLRGRGYTGLVQVAASGGYTVAPNVVEARDGETLTHTLTLTPPANAPFGSQQVTLTLSTVQGGPSKTLTIPVTLQGVALRVLEVVEQVPRRFAVAFALERLGGYAGSFQSSHFSAQARAGCPTGIFYSPVNVLDERYLVMTLDLTFCPPGTVNVLLVADNGQVRAEASLTLTVSPQELTATLDPQALTVYQGGTENLNLRLTPRGGLSGLVVLSLLEGSSSVPWASLSPTYVNLAPSGEQTFPLTLSVASGAPLSTRTLTLRLVHTAGQVNLPLSLTVREPTFHASLSPTSFTLRPGESAPALLTLTLEGGFTGTISLSLTGATGFEVFPGSIDTSATRWGVQIRNVSAAPGTYNLALNLTSGSVTRVIPITVTVPPPPDFTVSLSPTFLTVSAGSSGITTLTLTPQNGFTGAVSLNLVDDATGSPVPGITLSPTSVSVSGNGPQSFTLTVNVAASVASGTYYLRLEATSGSLTRTALLRLTVP